MNHTNTFQIHSEIQIHQDREASGRGRVTNEKRRDLSDIQEMQARQSVYTRYTQINLDTMYLKQVTPNVDLMHTK